jgi:hypothetical protein
MELQMKLSNVAKAYTSILLNDGKVTNEQYRVIYGQGKAKLVESLLRGRDGTPSRNIRDAHVNASARLQGLELKIRHMHKIK